MDVFPTCSRLVLHLSFPFLFCAPREVASFQQTFTYEASLKTTSINLPYQALYLTTFTHHPVILSPLLPSIYLSTSPPIHSYILLSTACPCIYSSITPFICTTILSNLQPGIHLPLISLFYQYIYTTGLSHQRWLCGFETLSVLLIII